MPNIPAPYYGGGQVKTPVDSFKVSGAPNTADIQHNLCTMACDPATGTIYALVAKASGVATWVSLASSSGQTISGGDLTVSAGNVVISGAAKQIRVKGGAVTDFIGTGTLASGTVTIANTNIAATDRIFLQRIATNGSTTLGELSYTISAATSFTVTSLILGTPGSTQTADTSTFSYFIVRQV